MTSIKKSNEESVQVRVKNEPNYDTQSIPEIIKATSRDNQANKLKNRSNEEQFIKQERQLMPISDSKRSREAISSDDEEMSNKIKRQSILAMRVKKEQIDRDEMEVKGEEKFSATEEFAKNRSIQSVSIEFLNEETTSTSNDNNRIKSPIFSASTHKRTYECDNCKKSYAHSNSILVHRRTHAEDKPFKCDICQKSFIQSRDLIKHKRIHSGEKPYECEVCKKSFSDSSNLSKHKRTHIAEKPYQCEICQKNFSHSTTLVKHRRNHSEEKPFKCELCQKSFIQSCDLIRHKRIHSGEKPYECEVSQKSFSQSCNLKKHERIHNREKL